MLNNLPVLNNYQVFTSPGYMMEEIVAFCFSSTYGKAPHNTAQSLRWTQFRFGI